MKDKNPLEQIFKKQNCPDFKWIEAGSIVVAHWVRLKCYYGCNNYGKSLSCPPNTPSIADCKEFFAEFKQAVIFRFAKSVAEPEDRFAWSKQTNDNLLKLEKDVFLSGCHKAFVLLMNECSLCAECPTKREDCKLPKLVRPTPEAMGVDVFATVRNCGFPIEVLSEYFQEMNRYAILLVE